MFRTDIARKWPRDSGWTKKLDLITIDSRDQMIEEVTLLVSVINEKEN